MCVKLLGKWQTVQTLIRRRVLRRLIWVYIVCSGLSVQIWRLSTVLLSNPLRNPPGPATAMNSLTRAHINRTLNNYADNGYSWKTVMKFELYAKYSVPKRKILNKENDEDSNNPSKRIMNYTTNTPYQITISKHDFHLTWHVHSYWRYFRFRPITWVIINGPTFNKLGMCIDIVEIWFGIANRQFSSIFDRIVCPPYVRIFVYGR